MNPLWLLVGLQIGDRIRDPLLQILHNRRRKRAAIRAYNHFIDSLPVKGGE